MTGQEISSLRKTHGYAKEDLAEILGVTPETVTSWEEEDTSPGEDNLRKLTRLFHIDNSEMLRSEALRSTAEFMGKVAGIFPVMIVITFLMMGFFFNLWHIAWVLFLLIPIFYICFASFKSGKPVTLIAVYPLIVVMLFSVLGMLFNIWHPAWIMFLTIPIVAIVTSK